jgi:hypothetical protein
MAHDRYIITINFDVRKEFALIRPFTAGVPSPREGRSFKFRPRVSVSDSAATLVLRTLCWEKAATSDRVSDAWWRP